MDHFVRRTARHHPSQYDYQRRSLAPPTMQGVGPSSSSRGSSLAAPASGALSSLAAHPPSSDLGLMHDDKVEEDEDGHDHHHHHQGMDALIDSLPESILREVLKSVAHLSTIQEALSTASTLSAPSTPVLGSSPARPARTSADASRATAVGMTSLFGVYPGQQSGASTIPESSPTPPPTRSRTKRAASLSPTRSPGPEDRHPVVKKPTLADATAAQTFVHSPSREASPQRYFARHTEVRRGYLRQTSHHEGGPIAGSSHQRRQGIVTAPVQATQQQQQQRQQQQRQQQQPMPPAATTAATAQAKLSKVRRGLLQYIHRVNLYYHGTLETKDAVISLLNIANFAVDPHAVLIKSPASPRTRPITGLSDSREAFSRQQPSPQQQQQEMTAGVHPRRAPGSYDPPPSYTHHHATLRRPAPAPVPQQPSPMTPQLSRAGTHISMMASVSHSPLHGPSEQQRARGTSPMSGGGRASLLPTPHASPSISSASPGFTGAGRRPYLDEAIVARMAEHGREAERRSGFGLVGSSSLSSSSLTTSSSSAATPTAVGAALNATSRSAVGTGVHLTAQAVAPAVGGLQSRQPVERGIVPISHEILSSLTMILLNHPGQKQRMTETLKQSGSAELVTATTEDGCDLEDWLLEAVYNLLEHETYKGQPMADTLSEYIVQVALARERRYRNQRMRHGQEQHQLGEQQDIREQSLPHQRQQQQQQQQKEQRLEEEDEAVHEAGMAGAEGIRGSRGNVEEDEEDYERDMEKHIQDGSFDAHLVDEGLEEVQGEETDADGQDQDYLPGHIEQGAGHGRTQPPTLVYPLYNQARFRWPGGMDSSDLGDLPTSDMAVIPSEPPSELATDLPPSEPPTELGEPIKLVMHSEDCFGAGGGPGEDGSVGNDSFRRHRNHLERDDDEDDEEEEEDGLLVAASEMGARPGDHGMMVAQGGEGEPMPSDLPSEMHDISRIDLASDLEPLIQELAEGGDPIRLYPMEQAVQAEDDEEEEDPDGLLGDHGSLVLLGVENVPPLPSEDWE